MKDLTSQIENLQNPEQKQVSLVQLLSFLTYDKIPRRPLFKSLGTQTVGVVQTAIAHNLTRAPNVVLVQMTSAGNVYQSATADKTYIYLISDHYLGRTCNVTVAYIPDNIR